MARACLCAILVLAGAERCLAQDLEPRRWSHLPTGLNYLGVAYVHTDAHISDTPALRLENVEAQIKTFAAKYIRTFELFQKSARFEVTQAYQTGKWEGLVNGSPATTSRSGFADTTARFAINLLGTPPLSGQDYARYRAQADRETIVGVAVEVTLPTGEYMPDRLINLGSNRYTFRSQIGVVHNPGPWSMELTAGASMYTDNDEFFGGSTLEYDPFLTLQGHLSYRLRPGVWVSAGAGYGVGAQSTVNGQELDDRKESLGWVLSVSYPLASNLGMKLSYLGSRRQSDTGNDTDSAVLSLVYFW